ncbi:MAG: hypothetical protein JWP63_7150 [Candidatus Solibacter sp.]|jgi:hypothetical protein|nr:hypothetical protein [Candidatus Solibacter sp.]
MDIATTATRILTVVNLRCGLIVNDVNFAPGGVLKCVANKQQALDWCTVDSCQQNVTTCKHSEA